MMANLAIYRINRSDLILSVRALLIGKALTGEKP
jgi:hypothetical protein